MSLLRVALTGGIATGKSYVLARFRSHGVPTVDADTIAHEVVRAGQPAAIDIRERFGDTVFGPDGELDRQSLARRVFDNADDRKILEAIVHPHVRAAIDHWFAEIDAAGSARFAVADIPLLFETGRETQFDQIVVTACPPELQLDRLMTRDTISSADAQKRIAAQLSTDDRLAGADFAVHTGGSFAETDNQVDQIVAALNRLGVA